MPVLAALPFLAFSLVVSCGPLHEGPDGRHKGKERSDDAAISADPDSKRLGRFATIEVSPMPGWPKWLGDVNHQISGLAFRGGHLYAMPDQSGAEKSALLEIDLDRAPSSRKLDVTVVCRWQGGPHPDAEGLVLDPFTGPPRTALMPLESKADALIEVGFPGCELRGVYGPLTDRDSNRGIEGIALSPDGRTVYLVHETRSVLLSLGRGAQGPAKVVSRIAGASSLCDVAYDDRGTSMTGDDRLLLLDRNSMQILSATVSGRVVGRWRLDRKTLQTDPDGQPYLMVSLESLAIESREADGSLIVYGATDPPPDMFPYHRRDDEDDEGLYRKRVGMLYRFRLPSLPGSQTAAGWIAPVTGGITRVFPSRHGSPRLRAELFSDQERGH